MAILMKQTIGGRRAYPITMAEGQELVDQGKARLCVGYEIFEEITNAEIEQGYMTRNMEPLPVMRKRRTRSIKSEIIDSYTEKLDQVGE